MTQKKVTKKQTFDLATIDVKKLKEFNGFEAAQKTLVKENPFIKVENHKTYEAAKKNAHALLKGRTALESQEKLIVKNITALRGSLKDATSELIDITRPAEIKQKAEIHAYENKKAEEKRLKAEEEAKAREAIRGTIEGIQAHGEKAIEEMTYETINSVSTELKAETDNIDGSVFGDLEELYDDALILLRQKFNTRKRALSIEHEQQKRAEELARKEEAVKKEREEMEAQREKMRIADIEARRNAHIITLMKAGYSEKEANVYERAGNIISLHTFTDRGGKEQYNVETDDLREMIDEGIKVERRVESLTPFKDLLTDDLFTEILRFDDNEFQLEINELIDRRAAATIEPEAEKKIEDLTVQAKFEELNKQLDVKDIEVVDAKIVTAEKEAPLKLSGKTIVVDIVKPEAISEVDYNAILESLESFGLDVIPENFETTVGAQFMGVIYDRFETVQEALKNELEALK